MICYISHFYLLFGASVHAYQNKAGHYGVKRKYRRIATLLAWNENLNIQLSQNT